MKSIKLSLAVLMLAAAFTACTKEEVIPQQELQKSEFVGAKLIGSDLTFEFEREGMTKVTADGKFELGDEAGLSWLVTGAYNSVQVNNATNITTSNLFANHLFVKGENGFATYGNIYEGWHFGYYPYVYMPKMAEPMKVNINPKQTEKFDTDVYTSSLYLSAKDFLTEDNLEGRKLNANLDLKRAVKTLKITVNPSSTFTGSDALKNLNITKIAAHTPRAAFYTSSEKEPVTLALNQLASVEYDIVLNDKDEVVSKTYNEAKTETEFRKSLKKVWNIADLTAVQNIETEIENDDINLTGAQVLRIHTLPAVPAQSFIQKNITFRIDVEGGWFDVTYKDPKEDGFTEEHGKNNEQLLKLSNAWKDNGYLTSFETEHSLNGVMTLNFELTADMFTPNFTSISSIDEWNKAVGVANALDMADPVFTVDGEIIITETKTPEIPANGLTVHTITGGEIQVAADYVMTAELADALHDVDVVKVNTGAVLTIPEDVVLDANVTNKGTIDVKAGAEVKTVLNAAGRIEVVYGSKFTAKGGIIAYNVLAKNETPARINTMIDNGVNTLVINKDVVLDLMMSTASVPSTDPYDSSIIPGVVLTDLSEINIEMNGGTIKGEPALTKSVNKVKVVSNTTNTIFDVNINSDLNVCDGTKATVDATLHTYGETQYKKEVAINNIHVDGALTANVTVNTSSIDNQHGNTIVNDNYTIWYSTEYIQGGSAKGAILKAGSVDGTLTTVTVNTVADLLLNLNKSNVGEIIFTDALPAGSYDLKNKTLNLKDKHLIGTYKFANGTINSLVYVRSGSTATFEKVTFTANVVTTSTGALEIDGGAVTVNVKECVFNTAGIGYPLLTGYNNATSVVVENSIFKSNGGANAYFNPTISGKVKVTGSFFEQGFGLDQLGCESKFDINTNTIGKQVGLNISDPNNVNNTTKEFVQKLIDNNTFNSDLKFEVWNGSEYLYFSKF